MSPARTATIAAGAASVVVTVQTTQDSLDEPAETFLLQLSAPVNAALATGKDEATGTTARGHHRQRRGAHGGGGGRGGGARG